MAYAIARSAPAQRNTWLMLVMLPFWTSFLVRCTPGWACWTAKG